MKTLPKILGILLFWMMSVQFASNAQELSPKDVFFNTSKSADSLLLNISPLDFTHKETLPALTGVTKGDTASKKISAKRIVMSDEAYPSYETESIPEKHSLLRSSSAITSAIGEIPMTTDVAPNGSMTVNIPIEFPAGIGDFSPRISLVYNNGVGNGVAGAGWNIGGLFPVTIRNSSIYYDGVTAPSSIPFNLLWEGKRFLTSIYIPVSNTAILRLEGSNGSITAVWNPDLTIYDNQGYTYRYLFDGNALNMYRLTKITDRHGNYIDYSYILDNNVYYISQISYGGNEIAGTSHTQTITFGYENRSDQTHSCHSGKESVVSKRLTSINTSERGYSLSYINGFYSQLSVFRCEIKNGNSVKRLEPLYFSYGTGIASSGALNIEYEEASFDYFTNGNSSTINAIPVSYSSSSGYEGFVMYGNKAPYVWGKLSGTNFESLHSYYATTDKIIISPSFELSPTGTGRYQVNANAGFRGLVALNSDFSSDTQETVLINAYPKYETGSTRTQTINFRIFAFAGGFFGDYDVTATKSFTLPAYYHNKNYTSVTPISYLTGNFKGDGRERILGVQFNSGTVSPEDAIILFDLETNNYYRYLTSFNIAYGDKVFAMDYDGDGKTDLFHFHSSGFTVYSFNLSNAASSTDMAFTLSQIASSTALTCFDFDETASQNSVPCKNTVLFGDINGDGKIDILKTSKYGLSGSTQITHSDKTWKQVLSGGSGQFIVTTYDMTGVWLNTYNDVFMHDFNGDGRSDVVCMTANNQLQVVQSNGLRIDNSLKYTYSNMSGYENTGKLFTIGINNSNYNRVIGYIKNNKVAKLSIDRNETVKAFLTRALTSHNVSTNVSYDRIDYSYCYTHGYYAEFPYENYCDYYWVVSRMDKQFKNSKILDLEYSYYNAVVHKQGLGFCGFEEITSYDAVTGRSTVAKYDPYHLGVVKKVDAFDSKIENTYDFTYSSYKEPLFRLTNQKLTDKKTNNITLIDNSYDNYGNLTYSKTQYGSNLVKEVICDYYNNFNGTYGLQSKTGFPLNTVTKTKRGTDSTTTSVHITYNDKLLPSKTIEKINGNIVSQTDRTFDVFSNTLTETITLYTETSRKLSKTNQYNSSGTKLIQTTDALGHTTHYNYTNNLLTSIIDKRGNTTSFEYDATRRVIRQNNPDGTVEETNSYYDTYDYYVITKSATGKPTKTVKYDGLHRKVLDFNTTKKSTEYDARGRISKISLPYDSSCTTPSLWNTYSYDSYDRITAVNYASGKKNSYSYNGNQVTSVVDGITSTKTYDAAGALVQASDPAGTITYNLRADGQPSSIVAPGNVTTSFTYDQYNRKTTITDPSVGTQTYTYDSRGNLSTEKDAQNRTTSYNYDAYNRLVRKYRPDLLTLYSYNNYGDLVSLKSGNGTITALTYDNLGRPLSEKETVPDGNYLQKDYGYSNGNVSWLSYSNQNGAIATENYEYMDGTLYEVKLNNSTTVWRLDEINNFGQLFIEKYGLITNQLDHDDYGFLRHQSVGYSSMLISDFYSFNPATGNLTYRKDDKRNIQENFSYDNLNRLTGYGGNTASYDIKGNITNRSDIGKFHYGYSSHPYWLWEVDVDNTSVPLRNQSVTYTSFKRPSSISENGYVANFTYNSNESRVKMQVTNNGSNVLTRYYISDCYEKDVPNGSNVKEKLYICGDFYSAKAVLVKQGSGSWTLYHIIRDYLGSIIAVTNTPNSIVQQMSYDAWGRMRNYANQVAYTPENTPTLFLGRGYTGHEYLPWFGLVNMNARLYDPALGRFLSADPYIQLPDFSQNFNRYSYALNNPLRYVDENGEFLLFYLMFCTDFGYDLQKSISPVAVKLDFRLGSNQGAIGIDASVGIPQIFPLSYRVHGGASYFWLNRDLMGNDLSGWETRYGSEWGVSGYMAGVPIGLTYSGTTFNNSVWGKQTTNLITLGNPITNIKYENDMVPEGIFGKIPLVPKGDGDRWRTAAAQINIGPFGIGTNMITGDPAVGKEKPYTIIDGKETYNGPHANDYRMGTFYFKFGPFRLGWNSEGNRKVFQNQFAHDLLTGGKSKWFEVLDLKPQFYWQFGYSGGGTLW